MQNKEVERDIDILVRKYVKNSDISLIGSVKGFKITQYIEQLEKQNEDLRERLIRSNRFGRKSQQILQETEMEKVGNYWIDENNNKWHCEITSEDQAIIYSNSLNDCRDCVECSNCSNCRNCRGCIDCIRCGGCRNCSDCRNCSYCIRCRGCRNCIRCGNCNSCSDYRNCRGNLEQFEGAIRETHKDNEIYLNQYLKEIEKVKRW